MRSFRVALLLSLLLSAAPVAARAAPSNDDFADAKRVVNLPFEETIDLSSASREPDEPGCSSRLPGVPPQLTPTVWYRYRATQEGTLSIHARGGGFVTEIAVFSPSRVSVLTGRPVALRPVDCGYEWFDGDGLAPRFEVRRGRTYLVRIGGGSDVAMSMRLIPTGTPANDDFDDALLISTTPFRHVVDTDYATRQAGEPAGCEPKDRTVWYGFTPTEDVRIRIDTAESDFGALFAIYEGSSLETLTEVACGWEEGTFLGRGGSIYWLQIGSAEGDASGTVDLALTILGPPGSPPTNDDFGDAEVIDSLPFTSTVDTTEATLEEDEPFECAMGRSVWYRFTPAAGVDAELDTEGSDFSTAEVGVYTGPSMEELSLVGCLGGEDEKRSVEVTFVAGRTYWIRAGGYDGSLVLNVRDLGQNVPEPGSISGPSPFASGCSGLDTAFHGSEVEPSVAVNPSDPQNIIAMWQQDRFPDGAAQSNVIGVSKDGGVSWASVTIPGISRCTGGRHLRATDPWISIGPDGTAYAASLAADSAGGPSAILVNTSVDGGLTWGPPKTIVENDLILFNDKESVTADPYRAGHAYVVWQRDGTTLFSATTDAGETWSPPTTFDGGTGDEILVLPDGSLLDISAGPRAAKSPAIARGLVWLPGVPIGNGGSGREGPTDPESGRPVRGGNSIPSADVGPDGSVWVAWAEDDYTIVVSSSSDGLAWSEPKVVADEDWGLFTPSIAVAADGTVGVTYYAIRIGAERFETHAVFRSTDDAGATWSEQLLGTPFDLSRAPYSTGRGWFLGDYAGLDNAGNDFISIRARTVPRGAGRYSDIYFDRISTD